MKLSKLKIRNYRSFGDEEQIIKIDDMTIFIGSNSSGKTAALAALGCLFSENPVDRILKRSDFHIKRNENPEDIIEKSLSIEAVFEFDELSDEGSVESNAVPTFFTNMIVESQNSDLYMRIRLEATWTKSNNIDGAIESRIFFVTCPESEEITDDNKIPANRAKLDSIRMIYVPAVRNPAQQLRNVSGTIMHQLISNIKWSTESKEVIKTKIDDLNNELLKEKGINILGESIDSQWKKYDIDKRYCHAKIQFNSTDLNAALKKSNIVFSPTETERDYTVNELGDGLRSLFYISLVDSILNIEQSVREKMIDKEQLIVFDYIPPVMTIVAIEEPENHIAPHLLGKLISNLNKISAQNNAQVIISSHSASIVKRIDPEKLRYFRINKGSVVKNITFPDNEEYGELYKYIKEAVKAYPELYFAKLVILGEGDSEKIIIPKFLEAKFGDIDINGISVIPLGGRHVNHFWRLLNDLDIPHVTLLDLDRERSGGCWGRIKYALEQLIKKGLKLKECEGVNTSKDSLKDIANFDVKNNKLLDKYINYLRDYNVYFSNPLDIDFLMLEKYTSIYTSLAGKLRLTTDEAIRTVLKAKGGNGETYTNKQKELMVYYQHLFLNRGKPTTHIEALSKLSNDELLKNIPDVFENIIAKSQELLSKGE